MAVIQRWPAYRGWWCTRIVLVDRFGTCPTGWHIEGGPAKSGGSTVHTNILSYLGSHVQKHEHECEFYTIKHTIKSSSTGDIRMINLPLFNARLRLYTSFPKALGEGGEGEGEGGRRLSSPKGLCGWSSPP